MGSAVGRRVASFDEIELPGDYCGPIEVAIYAGAATVWALLPTHPEGVDKFDRRDGRSGLIRVASPPHTLIEHDDGSLEVSPSIGVYGDGGAAFSWHGFLRASSRWEWDD